MKTNNFRFAQIVDFFSKYSGAEYIKPEKAGAEKEYMENLYKQGSEARKNFINFAKKLVEEFDDLVYTKCSLWQGNKGRGHAGIKYSLWIQIKNPKWQEQIQSISLSLEANDSLNVRVDIHQKDERYDVESTAFDPQFKSKILNQQFHLLDIPLKKGLKFYILDEDLEYGDDSVEKIRSKYKKVDSKPLIQVRTIINSVSKKDNEGKLFGEVLNAVRVVKTYYDYVMTLNSTNFKAMAESIDQEISELQLKGETKEAIVKLRVNQNTFRNLLLDKFEHCALCKVNQPELLVASHIKPWKDSSPEEKLDRDNGLLMCPGHDQLFDRGLISFDDNGNILISSHLTEESRESLGIKDDLKIQLSERNKEYLQYHREKIFQK